MSQSNKTQVSQSQPLQEGGRHNILQLSKLHKPPIILCNCHSGPSSAVWSLTVPLLSDAPANESLKPGLEPTNTDGSILMCTYSISPLLLHALVYITVYSVGGTTLSFVLVVMQREMNDCQGTRVWNHFIIKPDTKETKEKVFFFFFCNMENDERPVVGGSGCSHYCHYLAALDSQTKLQVMRLNPNRGASQPFTPPEASLPQRASQRSSVALFSFF